MISLVVKYIQLAICQTHTKLLEGKYYIKFLLPKSFPLFFTATIGLAQMLVSTLKVGCGALIGAAFFSDTSFRLHSPCILGYILISQYPGGISYTNKLKGNCFGWFHLLQSICSNESLKYNNHSRKVSNLILCFYNCHWFPGIIYYQLKHCMVYYYLALPFS